MAKKTYNIVLLVPEDDPKCGSRYYTTKSNKGLKAGTPLRLRKYNRVTRRHEWFIEKKLPNPSAK